MLWMGYFLGILGDGLKDDRINNDRRTGPCCRCGLLVRTDRFLLLVCVIFSSSTWYGCEGYLLLHRGLLHFEITPHCTTVRLRILRHFRSYFPLEHLSLLKPTCYSSCLSAVLFSFYLLSLVPLQKRRGVQKKLWRLRRISTGRRRLKPSLVNSSSPLSCTTT